MNQGFVIYVVVFYKALVHTWEIELHSLARVNERTIHGMPIMMHLWMNLNWVNIQFHLNNSYYKK